VCVGLGFVKSGLFTALIILLGNFALAILEMEFHELFAQVGLKP
jgi:uncharacterized membrane protein YhiD involved in acid resistance